MFACRLIVTSLADDVTSSGNAPVTESAHPEANSHGGLDARGHFENKAADSHPTFVQRC